MSIKKLHIDYHTAHINNTHSFYKYIIIRNIYHILILYTDKDSI
jgi:hypothetical protein